MKILVVDDEILIRNVINEYLKKEGFEYIEAENGEQAINIIKKEDVDLIIMDIMMPRLDGFSAAKEIKKIKDIPIIMLSARKEEYDKLTGFDLGIDDYVTKPFSPKELIARVKAVLSRIQTKETDDKYIYKDLEINYIGRTLKIENKEIPLTPKEYELLCFFVKNEGIALSREQLLNNIWNYDFYGDDRTIDTHIKMLRNNLGKYRDLIKTVRTIGYKYETKE